MPSLKDIRKRIGSVKNTQKITKAMKLVAAAKLRRAQDAIIAARPYAASLERVIRDLSARAGEDAHPLLAHREGTRAEILLVTSDRGLAGSFNAQLVRSVEHYVHEDLHDASEVTLRIVGKKGREYFKRRSIPIRDSHPGFSGANALEQSRELANQIIEDFTTDQVDRVFVVFNEFKSAISQHVLPVAPPAEAEGQLEQDFLYEPSKGYLLEHLLPLYIQVGLYRAALESVASEFGARMSAMDSATRNAGEMIDKLTLQYNRARQAAITKELLEIISGAEALKG
jgi:F-type H+-transporting ATPase subunit gamma